MYLKNVFFFSSLFQNIYWQNDWFGIIFQLCCECFKLSLIPMKGREKNQRIGVVQISSLKMLLIK